MKHNRGGFLVAVLLLVIAVAVAGIVYYVLRIMQTGPATATGGVEPTEPSSSAAPTGAPETDAPTETEAPTETTSPEELAAQEILDGMTLDEKLCQLFVVTPDALTGLSPATAEGVVGAIVLGMALCEIASAVTQTVLFRHALGPKSRLTGPGTTSQVLRGKLGRIAAPLGAAALLGNLIS